MIPDVCAATVALALGVEVVLGGMLPTLGTVKSSASKSGTTRISGVSEATPASSLGNISSPTGVADVCTGPFDADAVNVVDGIGVVEGLMSGTVTMSPPIPGTTIASGKLDASGDTSSD